MVAAHAGATGALWTRLCRAARAQVVHVCIGLGLAGAWSGRGQRGAEGLGVSRQSRLLGVFDVRRIRTLVEQRLVARQRGEEMLRGWRIVVPGHLLFPVAEQEQLMIEVVDISVHEGGGERVGCLPERTLQARPRVQTPLVPGGHDLLERVRVRHPIVSYGGYVVRECGVARPLYQASEDVKVRPQCRIGGLEALAVLLVLV